jgi:putative membrane protein
VEKLKDGAEELHDGMTEFDEDGIQKLAGIVNDDLTQLIDRMKAIQQVDENYRSFAGISDTMDGTVKFIIKTDSIG